MAARELCRVKCRAADSYNLAVNEGMVILAPSNASDDRQLWYIYGTDNSFSLINKATGQALKHFFGRQVPVRLICYNPNVLDESILWVLGDDYPDGYRQIRVLHHESYLEAAALNDFSFHGAIIIVEQWIDGNNQHNQEWKVELLNATTRR